jgi:hypothetical protein
LKELVWEFVGDTRKSWTGETTSSRDAAKDLLVMNISSVVIPNVSSKIVLFTYSIGRRRMTGGKLHAMSL